MAGPLFITNWPIASIRRAGDVERTIEAFSTIGKTFRTHGRGCASLKATGSWNTLLIHV